MIKSKLKTAKPSRDDEGTIHFIMLTFIIVVIACVGSMLMFIKLVEDDSDSDRRPFESAPKSYRLTATPESRPTFNEWAQKLPKPKEYND